MTMAHERLSRLQCRILAWLVAEDRRLRGTMAASHADLAAVDLTAEGRHRVAALTGSCD
jgi:hypothetical protein